MTSETRAEIKWIASAIAAVNTLIAIGWFAGTLSLRVEQVEQDQVRTQRRQDIILDKLPTIDRIGDAVKRIEEQIKRKL